MGKLPERTVWDADGAYEAALIRVARASRRGTGCSLTPAMASALAFGEGDGDYFQSILAALNPVTDSRAAQEKGV